MEFLINIFDIICICIKGFSVVTMILLFASPLVTTEEQREAFNDYIERKEVIRTLIYDLFYLGIGMILFDTFSKFFY